MSDVLARRFTESRPTAGAATSQAAVGTAARPMHIGITSAGSRWTRRGDSPRSCAETTAKQCW
jgi:hypothetical protein